MPWKIWFDVYKNGKKIGAGVWHRQYKYKGNATRYAKKRFCRTRVDHDGNVYTYEWVVSRTNPRAKL